MESEERVDAPIPSHLIASRKRGTDRDGSDRCSGIPVLAGAVMLQVGKVETPADIVGAVPVHQGAGKNAGYILPVMGQGNVVSILAALPPRISATPSTGRESPAMASMLLRINGTAGQSLPKITLSVFRASSGK